MKEVKIKVDGRELTVPAEWNLIKVCRENGVEVPHYCYHEDLSVAANCRMCMVGVKGAPRPVVACATPVVEGMEVTTTSPEVVEARKSVMEFLLINHPLDCPECDQAGECRLQDYSYEYGRDHGRFHEDKVVKAKATMGPNVKYWGSRCIVCTRCVRFTDEVSGTQELGVVNRGDKSEIAVFPGKTLDNPLSLNTVDICPVGALVSADFLYQSRVWHLKSKDSVCADCAVGCNSRVDMDYKGELKRIVPRRNDAVNKAWMCDYGRLSFPYVYENRLNRPLVEGKETGWKEARKIALDLLHSKNAVALVSAWQTVEALEGVKKLLEGNLPEARIFGYAKQGGPDEVFPGFTISGDKNPNRAGFSRVFGREIGPDSLSALARETSRIGCLLLLHGMHGYALSEEMRAILDRADQVVLLDFAKGELSRYGNVAVALPTLTPFEKGGTFVNRQGLAQTFFPVIEPFAFGRSEADILSDLGKDLAARRGQ